MGGSRNEVDFEVEGGRLRALSLGDPTARHVAVAVHGITASAMAWPAVAALLPDDHRLLALDLRGRGGSRDLPGPSGLLRHAADVCLVAEQLGDGRVTLVGHSMGAYVALLAAANRGDLFERLVLVDGGIPLPVPADADPDHLLAATLGPALERLRHTYPDVDSYVDLFRRHPALGPHWSSVIEDYVRYDVWETPEGVRSRAVEDMVRTDGRDLLVSGERLDAALRGLALPVRLLCAPKGMFGDPPGLLPADAVATYAALPHVIAEDVAGVNHYTILFDPDAAGRVAAAITGDLAEPGQWDASSSSAAE